ncbi:asparaginase domain-containing protein [Hydrogenimonas thermophila]|uniref:asparaginase domain-containing protein n=1 Tax=Hydrogenimonas thermophila TaxID=223786 RepID=UPI002936F372|nr:asparaginase domain-containing protein [Hydrogenimonas thermophila]WOE70751.1 asparaginase domain-containing protein [Hydrogenimonas thermophila]WOE73269.1 asparaginase domain-containing protein [Hydrogenimonas thermophila]
MTLIDQVIRIINTGGTFNKRYDPLEGKLFVPTDNLAVESAIASMRHGCEIKISGTIYKDSLEMDSADRDLLCEIVTKVAEKSIVIVHGTDTMDKSAKALDEWLGKSNDKRVVFTGAMVPFSIDPIEATANLVMSISSVQFLDPGVYIAMHGRVLPYDKIKKNREIGIFEPV